MNNIYRMWINQPSTLQPLHKYHAKNVLAVVDKRHPTYDVYFTEGDIISANVPAYCLSEGWVKND